MLTSGGGALGRIASPVQRHEEDRAAWRRDKTALEQRVAAAEGRAQATATELALFRDQHDALLAKLTAIEQTAERTIAALVEKFERATAALVALTEHQEVERQQRAAEADRHAAEVERLTCDVEEARRRELELTAERDRHAAAAVRLADEQRRRELELTAERDRHAAEAARLARLAEDHDLAAPPITDRDRQVADPVGISSAIVTCVAWTVAALTFTAARRARAGTTARTPGGRDARPTPARFPWIGSAASTSDLGAQGPRGPPARRG